MTFLPTPHSCCILVSQQNAGSLGTGAMDGCEPPVGAGNKTWVLCETSDCSKP